MPVAVMQRRPGRRGKAGLWAMALHAQVSAERHGCQDLVVVSYKRRGICLRDVTLGTEVMAGCHGGGGLTVAVQEMRDAERRRRRICPRRTAMAGEAFICTGIDAV